MGRRKIEMKRIENSKQRELTFSKRRASLFKKANELSILCEADVAVVVSSNGKLFDYASSSAKKILLRYKKCLEWQKNPAGAPKPVIDPGVDEVEVRKEEVKELKSNQVRLLGKEIADMDFQERCTAEGKLAEGIIWVKQRKEQLLLHQIDEAMMQGQHGAATKICRDRLSIINPTLSN
ncbi:agamous-like MADS-box protein AGL15 isoform X1 [Andrographis paniculata]|uniref:agamous-like MADS-box protein AGL15 isoform X1 n=1 Tax=Andrographis paniculata TaxID=175694 RepID=UPI0021E9A632|nr:agamous-like MADS-box protein AGL15 isoform X1 [Andrographis paniculata]